MASQRLCVQCTDKPSEYIINKIKLRHSNTVKEKESKTCKSIKLIPDRNKFVLFFLLNLIC